MALSKNDKASVFQAFKAEDGKPLQKLQAEICPETGELCIFWQDVQNTFNGVHYVDLVYPRYTKRVLFMVDQYGEVLLPLRIRCDDENAYQVIYREQQGPLPPALEFQYLYNSWTDASKYMVAEYARSTSALYEFSGYVAYYRSKLSEQLVFMREIGVEAEVDGKTEGQILDELDKFQKQVSELEYQTACKSLATRANFLAPSHFLALPADLRSWDDSDPNTHNFRLYFLCDVHLIGSVQSSLPQYKHLPNHPGYILKRPQEFFQIYGNCSLLFLKMAKQGFSYYQSVYPPLDTFDILWNFDPEVTSKHITKDTIGPLIDKSISFLESLTLPQLRRSEWRLNVKSDAIKDFLVVPEGSNPLGGLNRCAPSNIGWFWTCGSHSQQWVPPGTLEALVNFVHGCSGHVDTQRATLNVELHSTQQVDQFCTLLHNTEQPIEVCIRLGWPASHRNLDNLVRKIADTRVQHLVLDGVTHSMHPQGDVEYGNDIFYKQVDRGSVGRKLESVTILNYPRPQEQCTYFCSTFSNFLCRLHWRQLQQVEIGLWLTELRNCKVQDFVNAIVRNQREGHPVALQHQHDLLAKAGCETVFTLSMNQSNWRGEFDMSQGTFHNLQVYDLSALEKDYNTGWMTTVALGALRSLRTLTVDIRNLNIDQVITRTVEASLELQELNISVLESGALEQAARSIEMWHGRPSSLQLTLLERDNDSRGYVIVQLLIHGHAEGRLGSSNVDLQRFDTRLASSQKCEGSTPTYVEFKQWNGDHISSPLTDQGAVILDMATERYPSALISFVVDISHLSQHGLSHLQSILHRSKLNHLHVVCTPLHSNLTNLVRQVLLSVQWPTLQSLILSGPAVNEWIQLLTTISNEKTPARTSLLDLQLKSFRIQGPSKSPTSLSHSSMLFVHQLAHWSPSMELVLENVCLQDEKDMDLVAADFALEGLDKPWNQEYSILST